MRSSAQRLGCSSSPIQPVPAGTLCRRRTALKQLDNSVAALLGMHPSTATTEALGHAAQGVLPRRGFLSTIILTHLTATAHAPQPAVSSILVDDGISASVFDASRRSVVSIINSKRDKSGALVLTNLGTGVVWSANGYIVTTYRVVSQIDRASDVSDALSGCASE
jgi:S1-C subfamily serine protease